MTKTVLHGLAANKVHTWVVWLVGLATLSGTGMMVKHNLLEPNAEASSFIAPVRAAGQQAKTLLDLHGDPLPAGAISRLGTVRMRPGNEVTAVAFSPDGTKLACGPIYSNAIQIWDRTSGRLIQEFRGHRTTIMQIEFADAGKFQVTSSLDKTVRIWDTATGNEKFQLPTPWPGNFCLTADGRTLALSNEDRAIHLWDILAGKEIKVLKVGIESSIRQGFEPVALAFSPDGKRLATADQDTCRLWDVPTGRLESSTENGVRGQPRAACFNGANLIVLSSAYGSPCTLWSLAPGDSPRTLRVERAEYPIIAFAPGGGSLLFGSRGNGLRQWDATTGTELNRFNGMRGDARALAFSRDGKLAAAGTDGSTLQQWEIASGKEVGELGAPAAAVDSVSIGQNGQMVATTSADGVVHVWEGASGKQRWQWQGPAPASPTSVAISPDGSRIVAGGLEKGIRIFDAATGKPLSQALTTEPVGVLSFSSDGQTVLCSHYGRSVGWLDLRTGRERSRYPLQANGLNANTSLLMYHINHQRSYPPCVAASFDGRLAALGDLNELCCVRETGPGNVQVLFKAQLDSVSCLAFSADAKILASAGDEPFVLLWDVASGKPTKQLDARGYQMATLSYSPDGKLLAAGTSRGTVLLWDTATGKQIAQCAGHLGAIRRLAFTPDSKLLASAGGTDTTALIWDVATMQR